jgi:hypothetical protein
VQTITRDELTPFEGTSKGRLYSRTDYFGDSQDATPGPQGFLIEMRPEVPGDELRHTIVPPHFHLVRQFQVVVGGDEPTIGKHTAAPITFHYADPSTPYGPINSGPGGVSFFTLRPRGDVHAHWMPGSQEEMLTRSGRNVVCALDPEPAMTMTHTDVLWEPHDDGLASYRIVLAPAESSAGPAPAGSGGQYLLVTRGSLVGERGPVPQLSLIWVNADEPAPVLTAGADGCEALVLQFPRDGATTERD